MQNSLLQSSVRKVINSLRENETELLLNFIKNTGTPIEDCIICTQFMGDHFKTWIEKKKV
jgi:hypothetical protein